MRDKHVKEIPQTTLNVFLCLLFISVANYMKERKMVYDKNFSTSFKSLPYLFIEWNLREKVFKDFYSTMRETHSNVKSRVRRVRIDVIKIHKNIMGLSVRFNRSFIIRYIKAFLSFLFTLELIHFFSVKNSKTYISFTPLSSWKLWAMCYMCEREKKYFTLKKKAYRLNFHPDVVYLFFATFAIFHFLILVFSIIKKVLFNYSKLVRSESLL